MKFMWLKLFVLVSVLALFSCGGDDGASSEEAEKDSGGSSDASLEVTEDVETYESLDDLPNCTEKRLLSLAKVKSAYYVCADRKWKKVEDAVLQICDVPSCDESAENGLTYVKETNQLFQCNSGKWNDSEGTGLDDAKYVQCVMDRVATVSVKTEDDLNSCTKSRQGNVALVGEDFWVCYNSKWAPLDGVVMNQSSLPECAGSADGSLYYAAENLTLYRCYLGETVNVPTSSVAVSSESNGPVQNSSSSAKPKSSATSVNSSNSGASSSSLIDSSPSTVPESSARAVIKSGCTSETVGPTSDYGNFAFVMPMKISEGPLQKVYISIDYTEYISGPSSWSEFGLAIAEHTSSGIFNQSSAIYSNYFIEYMGSYLSTNNMVMFTFVKEDSWLETYSAGDEIQIDVSIIANAKPASNSISQMPYDYFSLSKGKSVCYRLVDDSKPSGDGYIQISEYGTAYEMKNGECAAVTAVGSKDAVICESPDFTGVEPYLSIVAGKTMTERSIDGNKEIITYLEGKDMNLGQTFCVKFSGASSVFCRYGN